MSGRLPNRASSRSDLARSAWAWIASEAWLLPKRVAHVRRRIIALSAVVAICVAGGTFAVTYGLYGPAHSALKGVGTWNFTGAGKALAESHAAWYYTWAATPGGVVAPHRINFVPMIWGASDVTTATLDEVKGESRIVLGFNEPDNSSQANMSVQQALSLWPKLMATGMALGSPAVSSGAATPGGWLDQFMKGAAAYHYRVNFICVHWYGSDSRTRPAVQQLQNYLQAVHDRYHLPIWLTEFALASFEGPLPTFATETQEAAFLTAATKMLAGLSYVQRYAWFALPVAPESGTAGLFASTPGPVATKVGRAFTSAG